MAALDTSNDSVRTILHSMSRHEAVLPVRDENAARGDYLRRVMKVKRAASAPPPELSSTRAFGTPVRGNGVESFVVKPLRPSPAPPAPIAVDTNRRHSPPPPPSPVRTRGRLGGEGVYLTLCCAWGASRAVPALFRVRGAGRRAEAV